MENTTQETKYYLPIEHISYSSMKLYCSNRAQFRKEYIDGNFRKWKESLTGVVGKACHRVLEVFYSGEPFDVALQQGFMEIETIPTKQLKFALDTKTRADLQKQVAKVIKMYFEEEPNLGKILGIEKSQVVEFEIEGVTQPLPLKARTDLISELDDEIHLWDFKFIDKFSTKEIDESLSEEENRMAIEKPDYIMQSMFNFYTTKAIFKKEPTVMHFVEIKKTENRDKSPQIQYYDVVYKNHPEYFKYFEQLYLAVINDMLRPEKCNHCGNIVISTPQFLPNFSDFFTGPDSWFDFTTGVMDFNMPDLTKIKHKSPLNKIEKLVQFKESVVDSVEANSMSEAEKIVAKYAEFGIPLKHEQTYEGANVSMLTFKPSRGVKMSTIQQYDKDIMQALAVKSVRIIAPIPNTQLVGIEISNKKQEIINLTKKHYGKELNIPIGVDVYGKNVQLDLTKAPHLLVAGSTGSGKSVFLNCLITSIINQTKSDEVELILIDPKRTEFSQFKSSTKVAYHITETEQSKLALEWLLKTMEDRYKEFEKTEVRNISEYVERVQPMKRIVVVVDEVADLLMSEDSNDSKLIRKSLIRLAQKSRASGIHVVIATQRPSVDVIDGVMKANFPTRIAFMTSTAVDSNVILDSSGAEKLIGNGDLLLMKPNEQDLIRLQGYFI